jgi:hypothetical protein
MQSIWNAKAASVGNSSLAKAFLAPCRINPDAGATRLIRYREAGAVAFRAFVLNWADDEFFHVSLKPAWQSPLFPTEGSQRPVPQLLRIAFARLGSLNNAFGYHLVN